MPYLIYRSAALKMKKFSQFGRIKNVESKVSNLGVRDFKQVTISGRLQHDMLQCMHKNLPGLNSYSLNCIAKAFANDRKEDLDYSRIPDCFH